MQSNFITLFVALCMFAIYHPRSWEQQIPSSLPTTEMMGNRIQNKYSHFGENLTSILTKKRMNSF